jgi:hypothetical protein
LGWPYYANTEGYGVFVPTANTGNPVNAFFVQDDWKVSPSLTLNLGLRWDLISPPQEQHDIRSVFDPGTGKMIVAGTRILPEHANAGYLAAYPGMFLTAADVGLPLRSLIRMCKDNFSPRFGFAYRPWKNNKTVIRGGYGMFYFLRDEHWMMRNQAGSPYQLSANSMVNTLPTPTYTIQDPFKAPPGAVGLLTGVSWDPDMLDPYTQEMSLGIQHELPWGMVGEANFQDQHAIRLDNLMNLNQTALGDRTGMPYPLYSSYLLRNMANHNNRYDALELSLRKNSTHYTFQFSYVMAKNMQAGIVDLYVGNIFRGPAGYVPTEAKVNFVLDLPVGKGRRFLNHGGVADAIIGGWTTSGFFILHQGGAPMTIGALNQTTNNNLASTGRPDRVCNGNIDNPTVDRWFDTSCFVAAQQNTWGNAGTGIISAPSRNMLGDFGIFKNFTIHEDLKLQFRTEMFNAFNHPVLNYPGTTFGSSTFGVITGKSQTPRVFQFALRLSF